VCAGVFMYVCVRVSVCLHLYGMCICVYVCAMECDGAAGFQLVQVPPPTLPQYRSYMISGMSLYSTSCTTISMDGQEELEYVQETASRPGGMVGTCD
jgi:hypothetical protein